MQTSVTGFSPFFGTSASAPNAAAIAGLVLSGNPGLSPAEVRQALTATAIDIVEAGADNRTGAGIVRADLVLAYTGASPQPLAKAAKPSVVERRRRQPVPQAGHHGHGHRAGDQRR